MASNNKNGKKSGGKYKSPKAPMGKIKEPEIRNINVEDEIEKPELTEIPEDRTYATYLDRIQKSEEQRDEELSAAKERRKKSKDAADWAKIGSDAVGALGRMLAAKKGISNLKTRDLDLSSYMDDVSTEYQDASDKAKTEHKGRSHQAMLDRITGQEEIDKRKAENKVKEKKYQEDVAKAKRAKKLEDREIRKLQKSSKEIDQMADKDIAAIDRQHSKLNTKFDRFYDRAGDEDNLAAAIEGSSFFHNLPADRKAKSQLIEAMEAADNKEHARTIYREFMGRIKSRLINNVADTAAQRRKDAGLLEEMDLTE